MADTIERIYKLTVDGQAAVRQLDNISKNAEQINGKFDKLAAGAIKLGTALAGAFAAGQIVSGIQRNIDAMDELSKATAKVGIGAEDLQRLRYAADLSGVSAEELDKAIGKIAVSMVDLKGGTTDAAKALKAIGAKEGESPVETLKKISDQFAKMPDGVEKTALAIKIFGKAGADLIPMLNDGGEALQKLADEADRFGGVISGGALKAAEAFNDNMSRLSRTASGIGAQISAGLLPALVAITDDLTDAAKAGDGFVSTGSSIGDILANVYGFALKASATLQAFGMGLGALVAIVANPTQAKTIFEAWVDDVNGLETGANLRLTKFQENLKKTNDLINQPGDKPKPSGGDPVIKAMNDQTKAIDLIAQAEHRRMLGAKILIEIETEQAKVEADLADQIERHRKEAEDAAKAQADLIASLDPAGAAAEQFAKNLATIDDLFFSGTVNAEQYERMVAQLTGTFGKTSDPKKAKDELSILSDSFEGFFENLAEGTADVEDLFKRMVQSIIAELLKLWAKKYIVDAIAGAFGIAPAKAAATGAVFNEGQVMPFARGGVISRPVVFPMALAGEAGPEGILPLKRTSSGDLGVQAAMPKLEVNVTNNMGGEAEVSTRTNGGNIEIIIDRVRSALTADVIRGGNDFANANERAWGLSRGSAAAF